ncbi:MAG: hypothetical protein HRU38_04955 [Saccharospirillaceae bacterium]|nr:hypothetical protein [Saccharospirillaceae bacterium]
MKRISVNSLLVVTVILLITAITMYWFTLFNQEKKSIDKQTIKQQSTQIQTTLNTDNNVNLADKVKQGDDLNNIKPIIHDNSTTAVAAKNQVNQTENDTVKNIDFSKYITDDNQIEEIRLITSRKTDDLVVEVLPNGMTKVDLKNRWSTVHVVVVDEKGEKQSGEWAPNKQ